MKLTRQEETDTLDCYNEIPPNQRIKCHHCKQPLGKAYCSRHDEYYNTGHKPDCPERIDRGIDHARCRR